MAYTVEQRTSEIGMRMALGADRASVIRMVLRGAFAQVGIGLGLGIPLAIVAGWLMTRHLKVCRCWVQCVRLRPVLESRNWFTIQQRHFAAPTGHAGELETDQLLMTQKERDRLVALKKAKKN